MVRTPPCDLAIIRRLTLRLTAVIIISAKSYCDPSCLFVGWLVRTLVRCSSAMRKKPGVSDWNDGMSTSCNVCPLDGSA